MLLLVDMVDFFRKLNFVCDCSYIEYADANRGCSSLVHRGGCVKTHEWHAPKGQKHIAQGNALGKYAPH